MRCQDGSSYNSIQRFHSESESTMRFHVTFYFAASAIIMTQTMIASVDGQCTTEGCAHDDLSMNIITEIQQQMFQALGPLNTQIQNMHDLLTSQHGSVMRSLEAVDRRLQEHDSYIKQGQSFHELLNESFQEMKSQHEIVNMSFQAVDRRLLEQSQSIHYRLNKSFQQMKSQFDAVDASLQTVGRNLENYQIDIKNQTEKSRRFFNDVCDPVYPGRDCSDIKARGYTASGVYEICAGHQPNRLCANAYCDLKNGTSLVFQRRKDGSVNFNRTWVEYKEGFGNPDGEFWLGNEMLYLLASKRNYKLRIDLEDWEGEKRYAEYSNFSISSPTNNYTLTVRGYSGNAGDSMVSNNGRPFTTIDVDNDGYEGVNCARDYGGAWWHSSCSNAKLNGKYYYRYDAVEPVKGILWFTWQQSTIYSLKSTEMKLVPVA